MCCTAQWQSTGPAGLHSSRPQCGSATVLPTAQSRHMGGANQNFIRSCESFHKQNQTKIVRPPAAPTSIVLIKSVFSVAGTDWDLLLCVRPTLCRHFLDSQGINRIGLWCVTNSTGPIGFPCPMGECTWIYDELKAWKKL